MGKIISSSIVSKHGVVEVIELGEHRACGTGAHVEDKDEEEFKSERTAGGEHLTRPGQPAPRTNDVDDAEEEADDETEDCRSLLVLVGEVHRNKRLYSLEDVGDVEARECFIVPPKIVLLLLVFPDNEVDGEEFALEFSCGLLLVLSSIRFLLRGIVAIVQR